MSHLACARKNRISDLHAGFTLVELLVVLGIIAVLVAILLPVLNAVRRQTQRVQCASNMRQWGMGLASYASQNEGAFPSDLDGRHISWIGPEVQKFLKSYLLPLRPGPIDTAQVTYCPTQLWHRFYRENFGLTFGDVELVGYFYMPFRDPNNIDYTPAGNGWVEKDRFGGRYHDAPILSDMIQTSGGQWAGPTPYSSHLDHDGIMPAGGNFLFEDGHVQWYPLSAVSIGATMSGWEFHYKIDLTQ